ncbi:MAG: hypothetical protein M9894_16825 [Planctomycetes bacterium]|nr:hypothetical protein [Planctomycetota bacterium]
MERALFRIAALGSPLLAGALAVGCGGSSGGGGGPAPASWQPTAGTDDPAPTDGSDGGAVPVGAHEPGHPAPRVHVVTAEGVNLSYPVWLESHPTRRAEMLEEIRTVVPEADPRIPADVRGVPAGTTLIVMDPGAYYAPYSPTLLASGEWRGPSTIYVAWRGGSSGKLLPALAHELRHLLTQDPHAGH